MTSLLPHVFAVRSASDLILLDVRDDAYALIVDALSDRSNAETLLPLGVPLTHDADAALRDAGLVHDAPSAIVTPLAPPDVRHPGVAGDHAIATARDLFDLLRALISCRLRLSRGMPCHGYRARRTAVAACPADVGRALRSLSAARLLVPTPSRCLPASLITSLFLTRRGVPNEIVFGVRTHPFLAHCWVEVDGMPVDDEPERVAAYLPICVADA